MDITQTPYPFPKLAIFDPAQDKRAPLRHLQDDIEVKKALGQDSNTILTQ
jgi:hypothetical protein